MCLLLPIPRATHSLLRCLARAVQSQALSQGCPRVQCVHGCIMPIFHSGNYAHHLKSVYLVLHPPASCRIGMCCVVVCWSCSEEFTRRDAMMIEAAQQQQLATNPGVQDDDDSSSSSSSRLALPSPYLSHTMAVSCNERWALYSFWHSFFFCNLSIHFYMHHVANTGISKFLVFFGGFVCLRSQRR